MKIGFIESSNNWKSILNTARSTVGKDGLDKEPSSDWKRRMLLAEHSPIRRLTIHWNWRDLMKWVSGHFVRHKIGIEHFVTTERTDRTGIDRNKLLQSSLAIHEVEANAQSIITISRKRLCANASKETREAWMAFLDELAEVEPELAFACVPDCVYRGHCYEMKSCGMHKQEGFQYLIKSYRSGINESDH